LQIMFSSASERGASAASTATPETASTAFSERSTGPHGIKVDRPEDLAEAWAESFTAGRPTVLEVVVDPEIPPRPPHSTTTQAKKMAQAMLDGDPERGGVMEKAMREKLREFLPGR
jgi:pyruvate dehydrogenase (quinone)